MWSVPPMICRTSEESIIHVWCTKRAVTGPRRHSSVRP
jgi:hypothetical protein